LFYLYKMVNTVKISLAMGCELVRIYGYGFFSINNYRDKLLIKGGVFC
jgi:hypothetical protein